VSLKWLLNDIREHFKSALMYLSTSHRKAYTAQTVRIKYVSPALCVITTRHLMTVSVSAPWWAHFCSDGAINGRLLAERVFSQQCLHVFVYPAACCTLFQTKVCPPAAKPLTQSLAWLQSPRLALPFLTCHSSFSHTLPRSRTIVPHSRLTLHHLFLQVFSPGFRRFLSALFTGSQCLTSSTWLKVFPAV